jgi:peptidoglycan hydrolase-like protein with peptidoglycan-binding domain
MRGRFAAPSGKTSEIGGTGCWSAGRREPVCVHRGVREVRHQAPEEDDRRSPTDSYPPETHWIPKPFERRQGVTPDGLVTPELISRLLSREKFTRMWIGQDELEGLVAGEEPVSYSTFVTSVFDLYGKDQGKRLVGD